MNGVRFQNVLCCDTCDHAQVGTEGWPITHRQINLRFDVARCRVVALDARSPGGLPVLCPGKGVLAPVTFLSDLVRVRESVPGVAPDDPINLQAR